MERGESHKKPDRDKQEQAPTKKGSYNMVRH